MSQWAVIVGYFCEDIPTVEEQQNIGNHSFESKIDRGLLGRNDWAVMRTLVSDT